MMGNAFSQMFPPKPTFTGANLPNQAGKVHSTIFLCLKEMLTQTSGLHCHRSFRRNWTRTSSDPLPTQRESLRCRTIKPKGLRSHQNHSKRRPQIKRRADISPLGSRRPDHDQEIRRGIPSQREQTSHSFQQRRRLASSTRQQDETGI